MENTITTLQMSDESRSIMAQLPSWVNVFNLIYDNLKIHRHLVCEGGRNVIVPIRSHSALMNLPSDCKTTNKFVSQ